MPMEPTVPLGVLLRREVTSERMERPDVLCGEAALSRKGEDFTLLLADAGQRVDGDPSTSFSVFALFDGHNGSGAAIYAKENLLNNVLRATPSGLSRDEWLAVLPRSLVAAFVKTDKDLQAIGKQIEEHSTGNTILTNKKTNPNLRIQPHQRRLTTMTADRALPPHSTRAGESTANRGQEAADEAAAVFSPPPGS